MCILTLLFTWSPLRIWREDFSLSIMATVVNLSKNNTYLASLFVWCISGAPCVFHGKTCAHDELIRVVRHVWLTVNLTCAHNKFACVVHF